VDAVAVIRSVGERTEAVCRRLVEAQLGIEAIVIHETPFERALERGFEIGAGSGRAWLLAIDADHLVRPNALRALFASAEASSAWHLQGRFICKFYRAERDGGPRLYRTAMLPEALSVLPIIGEQLRPESRTVKRMAARGHETAKVPVVTCLHDHEQWYADIFRKGALHAVKFPGWRHTLVPLWERLAGIDLDFAVLLAGWRSGLRSSLTDASAIAEHARAALGRLNLHEKAPLAADWNPWESSTLLRTG